jgi:hypothetical protein
VLYEENYLITKPQLEKFFKVDKLEQKKKGNFYSYLIDVGYKEQVKTVIDEISYKLKKTT